MPNSMISDDAFRSARVALDAITTRQAVIGQNIANVDTPGYTAQTVKFEDSLKAAMRSDDNLKMATTSSAHLAAPKSSLAVLTMAREGGTVRADGNNVDLDTENAQLAEDALRYETLSQLVSKKLLLLKTIAMTR